MKTKDPFQQCMDKARELVPLEEYPEPQPMPDIDEIRVFGVAVKEEEDIESC